MKYIYLSILALIFGAHGNQLNYLSASISPNASFDRISEDPIDVKLDRDRIKVIRITEKTKKSLTIHSDIEVSWYGIRLKDVSIEEAKKQGSIFNGYEIRLKNAYMDTVRYYEEVLNENGFKQKTWIVYWHVPYELIFKYGILPFEHKLGYSFANSRTINVRK
ncbi:MAG: hypothetical protein CML12_04755 [Puniceicoccaceae bacterium]|nr:hypothetical protein [Puniceicoccaceae bacterium]